LGEFSSLASMDFERVKFVDNGEMNHGYVFKF